MQDMAGPNNPPEARTKCTGPLQASLQASLQANRNGALVLYIFVLHVSVIHVAVCAFAADRMQKVQGYILHYEFCLQVRFSRNSTIKQSQICYVSCTGPGYLVSQSPSCNSLAFWYKF